MASPFYNGNRRKAFIITILVVGTIIFHRWRSSPSATASTESLSGVENIHRSVVQSVNKLDAGTLFEQKEGDVTQLPEVPESSQQELSAVSVKEIPIAVDVPGQKLTIYSLQTTPKQEAKMVVLLLHGMGDNSHNWEKVKTLQLLALWGYRAVAVDLPGHGNSKEVSLGGMVTREDFMGGLVKALGTTKSVIVAPSMAGSFALPFLFQNSSVGTERAAGLIAVAPTTSEMFLDIYPHSLLRTLILYGVGDEHLGEFSRRKMQTLPRCHIITLPDAGHACFKEQPDLFHRAVYHYLDYLVNSKP